MKYLSTLIVILSMAIVSCNKNDAPTPPSTQHRISFIYSDDTTQLFDYDSDGNITAWQKLETKSSQTIANASYVYDADGSSVKINADELRGDQKWIFEEVLSLNVDGTVKSAEGVVGLYRVEDSGLLMKKRYTVVFNYNLAKQLESIRIVEKHIADYVDDPYPIEWNIDLAWSNNKVTGYKEYSNPAAPIKICEYTYYDGIGVDYAPIVQYPVLRDYYTPLHYQGRFGVKSSGLVKKITVDNIYTTDFSYNISTNSTKSIVEEYSEKLPGGREIQYTIGWE